MPHTVPEGTATDAGFTLIEAIVGIALLALGFVALQQALTSGWGGLRRAQVEAAAVSLVQAQLAAAGVESPLRDGQTAGETRDGMRWTLEIQRQAAPNQSERPQQLVGYWLKATASWRDFPFGPTRSVALTTLKLGPPPP
jgi:type II secretory pathway pseudopilin PulG